MTDLVQQPELEKKHLPWSVGVSLAIAIIIALAVFDLLEVWTPLKFNLSILYIVPLLIYAHTRQTRGLLWVGLLLIVLIYAKFAVLSEAAPARWHARILNRSFAAISVGVITLLLHRWGHFRHRWQTAKGTLADVNEEGTLLRETFTAMEQWTALLVASVLTLGVFITDLFVAPGEINMPILYLVPLAVIGLTCQRGILWTATAGLIALAFIGYTWGPTPHVEPSLWSWLITNRTLACAALVLTAVLLRFIRTRTKPSGPA